MSAPGRVELHEDDVLGHDEVGEGVAAEDAHAAVLDHQVVAGRGLQGVDIRLQITVILPKNDLHYWTFYKD